MSGPRIPIARIKNNVLRRATMCVVFPLLIVIYYALPLAGLPFISVWRILSATAGEFADIVSDIRKIAKYDSALLKAGWLLMWRAPDAEIDA